MYSFTSPEDTCVMTRHYPLKELLLARLREFVREPLVIFWVYGFPLLLALGLGIAFRNRPVDRVFVDVQDHPGAPAAAEVLRRYPEFMVEIHSPQECMTRLRLGKSSIVVNPGPPVTFLFDPTRPESALARGQVDDALQQSAGRQNPLATRDRPVTEPGSRYIDFLVPGLLGMNLMGGGLWGVGFLIIDMRVKKLLKRLMATPMKKAHLLGSMIGGRLVFTIPEVLIILGAGALLFNVAIIGSWAAIFCVSLFGAIAFASLGLLVASRAQRLETGSGLINLLMLPMWLLSGIFFSPDRFPAILQPLVQALPLTQLNYALRAVILEGASVVSQSWRLAILAIWASVSFACALRWFRWH
jgi:ABC-type multidrug transport system permease subunit